MKNNRNLYMSDWLAFVSGVISPKELNRRTRSNQECIKFDREKIGEGMKGEIIDGGDNKEVTVPILKGL